MESSIVANSQVLPAEKPVWYALRVTYNRSMLVKNDFDSRGLESFLPMQYREMRNKDRLVRKLVPAISNLIFLHITTSEMRQLKADTQLPIRYIMDRETRKPIQVPDRQMELFIAVAGTYDEQIVYLGSDLSSLRKGQRVRVLGGVFEGTEGYVARIKGDRRVVVEIKGVTAVATTFIHPSLLQILPDDK